MPYKSDKFSLSPEQDRRRKLLDDDKEAIRILYATGKYSLQTLANDFGVSKKTVLLIVNADSAERSRAYKKEHWREFQQTKEEHAAAVRKTRRYKHQLYVNGELKPVLETD